MWGDKVSGGVDVFFVVSGFFITLTLLGHVRRYGRIRPGAFLLRLGQRLGPMALLVLAATIVLSWTILPSSQHEAAFSQSIAALFSVENLYLAFQSVDYLAQDQPHSPVQQFWAMSVQGQFYILWLGLAVVAVAIARRRDRSPQRVILASITVVAAASFAWSIVQTSSDQAFAYFSPLTRAWEFAIGGAIAILAPRIRLPLALRVGMIWVGVTGIVLGAVILPVESSFPGFAALWPTISAGLVLLSGQKGDGLLKNAFLNARPLVAAGGFAFAIYLWHWPLLIAARTTLGREKLDVPTGVVVIGLAVLLAWASRRLVEQPMISASRSTDEATRHRANSLLLVAWVAVLGVAGASLITVQAVSAAQQTQLEQVTSADGDCFGARAVLLGDPNCTSEELGVGPFPEGVVKDDLQLPERECYLGKGRVEPKRCVYGVVGAEHRIGLIGNSHAVAWFPALERVAIEAGVELHVWYKRGCQFTIPQRAGTDPTLEQECNEWASNVRDDLIAGPQLDWVLTSAHGASEWTDSHGEPSEETAKQAVAAAWQAVLDDGTDILFLRDYPKSSDGALACVERLGPDAVDGCASSRAAVLYERQILADVADSMPGTHVLDLNDAFCDAETCWSVAGQAKVYRDRSHLSNSYAGTVSELMATRLDELGLLPKRDG